VCGFWFAARDGIARLLANYAVMANLPVAADEAIRFHAAEPEAHYARAILLKAGGQLPAAIHELEIAVSLRPQDSVLWQDLASTRDQADDVEGALRASREAVALAPSYAEPRWQLGNLLFRSGRRDEGLSELRRAAESDPTLLLSLIDLSWNATGGDVIAVQQLINPQTTPQRLELSRFFIKVGKVAEAMTLFRASIDASETERRDLLSLLLAGKHFPEAHEVWSSFHHNSNISSNVGGNNADSIGIAQLDNAGFEDEIALNDAGFSWQLARELSVVHFAQDGSAPHAGSYSLRIEFGGDTGATQVITQHVLVEPNARYRLTFAARTEEMMSGGLPLVAVSDATSSNALVLGQSTALPRGSNAWRDYAFEFTTSAATEAVIINVRREACSTAPCPIFGRLWLDDFVLKKL
jgi:tetratricopeptide (TPR) repeat protein